MKGAATVGAWRPEVVAFADAMEHKLRENDWKGGWKDDASGALMERVSEEMREFKAAHLAYPRDTEAYRTNLRNEGADVANMVMMVLDVCGALPVAPKAEPTEVERLRAEQADAVMPQIGPLLDAWDGMDNDTKATIREEAPDLAKTLNSINRAMETGKAPQADSAQPVVADTLTDEDIEQFIYERCRRVISSDMIPAIRELIAARVIPASPDSDVKAPHSAEAEIPVSDVIGPVGADTLTAQVQQDSWHDPELPPHGLLQLSFAGVPEHAKEAAREYAEMYARQAIAAREVQPARVTKEMVDRFLSWKLPSTVYPDCGRPARPTDVGTNLLTAYEARQMLEHVLASPPRAIPAEQAAPTEPAAYVIRDAEGGFLRDFTDYYDADQFWIHNSSRLLKPQFLFCYEQPAAHPHEAADRSAEAKEAAAFRWLLANCIKEDEGGWLVLSFDTSRQARDHVGSQAHWVGEDIDAAMGTPAAAEPGKGEGS